MRMFIKNEQSIERQIARDKSIEKQKHDRFIADAKLQQRRGASMAIFHDKVVDDYDGTVSMVDFIKSRKEHVKSSRSKNS